MRATLQEKPINKVDQSILEYIKGTKNMMPQGMCQMIATELHISREYVRLRAKKLGLIMARDLGNEFLVSYKKCKGCGIKFKGNGKTYHNLECRRIFKNKQIKKSILKTICENCGNVKKYSKWKMKPRFCSRSCQASVWGKTHGFTAHPENQQHNLIKIFRKYL